MKVDLVEEELLPEFTTYPEFLPYHRNWNDKNYFQKWCTQQEPKSPQTTINEGAFLLLN